jgi:pyruvate/2-oxoacid:ferredoxin oxidoreductase beta subunit
VNRNRTPLDNFSGYCQGCKQFAVLRLVDSWRYRCNYCIAADALAGPPSTPFQISGQKETR